MAVAGERVTDVIAVLAAENFRLKGSGFDGVGVENRATIRELGGFKEVDDTFRGHFTDRI